MYLEVHPSGAKYWRLKYRWQGKEKRLALGVYPKVGLKDARGRRDKAKQSLERRRRFVRPAAQGLLGTSHTDAD